MKDHEVNPNTGLVPSGVLGGNNEPEKEPEKPKGKETVKDE